MCVGVTARHPGWLPPGPQSPGSVKGWVGGREGRGQAGRRPASRAWGGCSPLCRPVGLEGSRELLSGTRLSSALGHATLKTRAKGQGEDCWTFVPTQKPPLFWVSFISLTLPYTRQGAPLGQDMLFVLIEVK